MREIGSRVVSTLWACRKIPCANWWENWSHLRAIFQIVRWKVPFPKRIILLVDRVGPRKRNCLEHQGLGMRKDFFFFSLKDSLICFLLFSEIWSPVSSYCHSGFCMQMPSSLTLTPLHWLRFSVNNQPGTKQKNYTHSHPSTLPFLLRLSPSSSAATETGANAFAVVCDFDLAVTEDGS